MPEVAFAGAEVYRYVFKYRQKWRKMKIFLAKYSVLKQENKRFRRFLTKNTCF